MSTLKHVVADVAQATVRAAGDVLIQSIGGTPTHHPGSRPELIDHGRDFDAARQRLEDATGREHHYADGEVAGRLVGKVNLAGQAFARIAQQDGKSFALTPWHSDMTRYVDAEVVIRHEKGRNLSIEAGRGTPAIEAPGFSRGL